MIIRSDAQGSIYALETNDQLLDGRHYSYHVAIDPDGELLWRFPVNAQPSLAIGPDGGYYYVDWQDISIWEQDYSLASWCNITVLNHDGSMRWDYVADGGTLQILSISDQGGVVARHSEQYLNLTTNVTGWAETILSLSPQGELLWEVEIPYADTFVTGAQHAENGTIELFALEADSNWTYRIGMGEEGDPLYKVVSYPYLHFFDWTGLISETDYHVERMTTAPHTEVAMVRATNLTDGSLQWETVIWVDESSDEPYPNDSSSGWSTLVDSNGIIYASDMDGEIFALDLNGTVLWHRDGMEIQYGCFPSGGLLIGDGSSYQRIDGDGDVVWFIDGLDQTATDSWTIIIPNNDTLVLSHEGAVTEVTVNSEPQFSDTAAVYLVLVSLVVGVLVTILFLVIRKDKSKD